MKRTLYCFPFVKDVNICILLLLFHNSDPGALYWEQLESSLFPINRSRNSILGTGPSKLYVPYKLFPEQQIGNIQENLLFPISCSRNTVPGTEKVHQTYLLQFRLPEMPFRGFRACFFYKKQLYKTAWLRKPKTKSELS